MLCIFILFVGSFVNYTILYCYVKFKTPMDNYLLPILTKEVPASYKPPALLLMYTAKSGKGLGSDRGKTTSST
jgi:hypothetical protein